MINFNEEKHSYTTGSGKEYTSVTTLISQFKDKFDSERIAYECEVRGEENESYKYAGMSQEEILKQWEKICGDACIKGNKYHRIQELRVLFKKYWLRRPLLDGSYLIKEGYQDYVDLYKLEEGIEYPELRVFWDEHELAGHIDYVFVDFGKVIDIKDYKTNKRPLSKKGYKGKMMNPPLDFLPDSSYFHYSLQLNLYGWILEQYGYKIRSLEIIHKRFLDDEPIPEQFKIPFMSEAEQRRELRYDIKYKPEIIELLLDGRNKKS